MNKVITILALHFAVLGINAQSSEKNPFYLTGEIASGNYLEVNLNLNYIIKEKTSLQLGYSGHTRSARSIPADYSSGLLLTVFTLGLSELKTDNMENFQFLIGRVFSSEKGFTRFNLAGGVGYTIISEPTNWVRVTGNPTYYGLGPNYTYDIDKYSTISLIINPKIEFPFTRFFGLTISPMLQINKDRSFIGIGFGTMIGLLRKKAN